MKKYIYVVHDRLTTLALWSLVTLYIIMTYEISDKRLLEHYPIVNYTYTIPTADAINSIKPDQAILYWSCSAGISDREWSGATFVGIARASYPNIFGMWSRSDLVGQVEMFYPICTRSFRFLLD